MYFLSPPVKFGSSITEKTNFKLKPGERRACAWHPKSAVRFMLMERAKYTVHDLIDSHHRRGQRVPLVKAIQVMEQTIGALRHLHARGIVHGDIHTGNVAIIDRKGEEKIALIDFGYARFEDEGKLLPDLIYQPMKETHCLFSHWNSLGARSSYRDDVFKTPLLGAYTMNGAGWWTHCSGLESRPDLMLSFKAHEFFFAVPGMSDPISRLTNVGSAEKAKIRASLTRVLELTRAISGIDARPPYQELIDALAAARRTVETSSIVV
jgi:serine/threonine protein kinase